VAGSLDAARVIALLERLFGEQGAPQVLRSDNGPEFIALALKVWALMKHSETATIEPGKPWQNGSVESFNGTFRGECLDREWFTNLREARIVIEQWRWEYNTQRPYSSLGYRTPAEMGRETRKIEAATQPTTADTLS
jgi:putative transposase